MTAVHSLRTRLTAAFVVATVLPLGATIWITTSLIDQSLAYASTAEIERLSAALERTARQLYQRERDALGRGGEDNQTTRTAFARSALAAWPGEVREFWESAETERFVVSGPGGESLDLYRRADGGVDRYRRSLGGARLQDIEADVQRSRQLVSATSSRDLRRGFTLTLWLLVAGVWIASLVPLLVIAHRLSQPIGQLTAALTDLAAGNPDRRIPVTRHDEVGQAVSAFNTMADQLQRNRERLVYLTQMSSWQTIARKTAHELKNSLTPIRLTVEEMLARQPRDGRVFMEQATQIVVSEIETLERRVRAFSEFASEPPLHAERLDLNAVVADRIALLSPAHPDTVYRSTLAAEGIAVHAGADLLKGLLTNLLENAAEAAGPAGTVLVITATEQARAVVEIHDSGTGVSEEARRTLFEPTISFKQHGMGLGLSIARKHALVMGGDITLVQGALGGAGFRVTLPLSSPVRGVSS